jgi:peptidoglycan/LPS O-acetylase OafA/YrhL
VSQSWRRSLSWRDYAARRARRVLPGYLAVVLFWVISGAALGSLTPAQYFLSPGVWKNLAANLVFLQPLAPALPGLFTSNPTLTAVNGSLWSIRTEILCYLLLPFACRLPAAAAAALGGAAAALALDGNEALRAGIAQPIEAFFLGALIAASSFLKRWLAPAGAVAAALLVAMNFFAIPAQAALAPCAIAFAVLAAALSIPYMGDAARFGDFSYGLYLWHFPLIQTFLLHREWVTASPWTFAATASASALAFAAGSWFLVERRFLHRRGL